MNEIGKAEASKASRSFHTERASDASLDGRHSLGKVAGPHEAPFALGSNVEDCVDSIYKI